MPLRKMPRGSMLIAILAIVIGSVALDQITKAIVVSNMALHEEIAFLPGFMRFYHTQNTGAAFSMLSGHRWVFMVFSVVAMGLIVYLLYRFYGRHPMLSVSLAAVLGGGIGNMIDRVLNGYVVDFLDFQFMEFAVFNVADIFVTCGTVALAVYILFVEPRVEKRLAKQQALQETPTGEPHDTDEQSDA